MTHRTGAGGLVGVLVVLAGALVGLTATRYALPSDGDIADAAEALVPSGGAITEVIAGRPGENLGVLFDYRAGYRVMVRATASAEPLPDRLNDAEATAASGGWDETGRDDLPNAVAIDYGRGLLVAKVSVRKATTDVAIEVKRDGGAVRLRRAMGR